MVMSGREHHQKKASRRANDAMSAIMIRRFVQASFLSPKYATGIKQVAIRATIPE